jgi:hypothetical protein
LNFSQKKPIASFETIGRIGELLVFEPFMVHLTAFI